MLVVEVVVHINKEKVVLEVLAVVALVVFMVLFLHIRLLL